MLEIVDQTGTDLVKIEDIRDRIKMDSNSFTKYRTRLLDSGVVDGKQYGYLKFKLPRIEEYIRTLR